MEQILTFNFGIPCLVHFSGDAGTTFCNHSSQSIGIAFRADTAIVDMLAGSYADGGVYLVRATKQSVGNYTVSRKKISLS